jgi:DNA repair protein RecO (recombination protein O)
VNKTFSTECLILKNSNFKDADKLYTLFSPVYGKFTATAKGIRRINSKRLGSLDTLNRVQVSFSESHSGIKTIHQAQILESHKDLKKTMSGIAKGLYIVELVHRFFYHDTYQHESAPEIYGLLVKSLQSLNKFYAKYPEGSFNFVPVRVMNIFEARLMGILGYEMSLDSFLLNRLELGEHEVEYLKSLKSTQSFGDLKMLQDSHKAADAVIKEYVLDVLDERIYSSKLF